MATLPAASTPQLPREYFIPTGVPSTSVTKTVGPGSAIGSSYDYDSTTYGSLGAALQAALDACSPGWKIILTTKHPDTQAALVYDGSFKLKVHNNTTTWSVLTTDKAENGSLVTFGYRVDPSDTALMPTINVSSLNAPALYTSWNDPTNTIGGHYWYICGIHFTNSVAVTGAMIGLGTNGGRYAWLAAICAHHIVIDRCWVQGSPNPAHCSRGILVVGHHIDIVNSYIHGFAEPNADAQGIAVSKGIGRANYAGDIVGDPSPVHIENCLIEAEHESMNVGGDFINFDDLTENEVTDVVIRGNFITKDLRRHPCAFTGVTYDSTLGSRVKNLMEFKHGNRIIVEGNHFRNSWQSSDNQCYGIVLNVRPHDWNTFDGVTDTYGGGSYNIDGQPNNPGKLWPGIRDITMQHNIFEGMRSWLQLGGSQFGLGGGRTGYVTPAVGVATRWLFKNNLIVDCRHDPWCRITYTGSYPSGTYTCSVLSTDESVFNTANQGTLALWICSNPATTDWKGGPDYVTFDHNTYYYTSSIPDGTVPNQQYWGFIFEDADDNLRLHTPKGVRFTDNIVECGNKGFFANHPVNGQQFGQAALNRDFGNEGYTIQGNVFVNYGGAANSPPNQMQASTMVINSGAEQCNGNYLVKTWSQCGYIKIPADGDLMYEAGYMVLNPTNGNAAATADTNINANTNLLGKATDGLNPGCDMTAIRKYTSRAGRYTMALGLVERGEMQSVRAIKNRRFGV